MTRYPDKIIILEAIGGDPYNEPTWRQVYSGRCRCFLHRESAFRTNKVMDSTHQVVIPDRNMPEIGENFKVGVKMHTNESNRNWDLVGYVKDFARYDRVCNLNFQMVKENLIYEDIPAPAIDIKSRKLANFEDEWLYIESVGVIGGSGESEADALLIYEDEIVDLELKKFFSDGWNGCHFFSRDAMGEWVEQRLLPVEFIIQHPTSRKREDQPFESPMYAFYPIYLHSGEVDPKVSDKERSVIRIDVLGLDKYGNVDYDALRHRLYIQIVQKDIQ